MPISAGELDRFITIQQNVDGSPSQRDAMGGIVDNWTDIYSNMPASKRAATQREVFTAAQNAAQIDAVFVTRFQVGIDATMRIVCEGTTYEIQGDPQEIGRREGLLFKVKVKR